MTRLVTMWGLLCGLMGCGEEPKQIQVKEGPWREIVSEQPAARFSTREVEPGAGPVIRLGNLAQIRVSTRALPSPERSEESTEWTVRGDTWVWVGFLKENAPFFLLGNPDSPELRASLIGAREGSTIEFESTGGLGQFDRRILASRGWYSPTKMSPPDVLRLGARSKRRIEILLVCEARFTVREVDLIDTSIYHYSSGFQRIRDTTPRTARVQIARIEGPCSNGQYARFNYGPTFDPTRIGYFRPEWFYEWAVEQARNNVGVVLGPP